MGGNQSYQFDEKLFNSQWQRKQGNSFDSRTIWVNKNQPSRQIQEYPVYADTEDQIDTQRQLFSLRRDSSQLVAAVHLKQTVKGGLCSSSAQGRLFLQKIPLKLEALQHIPFPDILHVHFNALTGYKRLNKTVGPFRPGSQQIGFNNEGEAKVWMNSDFSASSPSSIQISQVAMVRNLLQIIEDVTDINTTPRDNPSIMNYIYRTSNDINFDQALNSIKDFANLYNSGVIPKNLECLHRVGIEKVSRSIITPRDQSINSGYFQTQRSNIATSGVAVQQQQPFVAQQPLTNQQPYINQQPFVQQYRPQQPFQQVVPPTNAPVYQRAQVIQSSLPVYQPIQVAQQPIQVVQQPIQSAIVSQPAQIFGASGVRVQNNDFNQVNVVQVQKKGEQRFLQSQVQTVRPSQQIFIRPEQQRVIQQIVRSPQGPIQVIPQSQIIGQGVVTTSLDQGSRVNQQNIYNQIPLVQQQVQQQVYSQPQSARQEFPVNREQLNFQNNLPEEPKFSDINKQSQVQILNQLQKQTSRQSEIYQLTQLSQQNRDKFISSNNYDTQQFVPRNRNFIDSNTMSIGIDKKFSQQLQSFSTSPQKSQIQKSLNLGSSKFNNDVSLEDGKSSEALLAQLRGFTSSKKQIPTFNAYEFSSSSYATSNNPSYDFKSTYNTVQPTIEQSEDIFTTFNKYSGINNKKWDQNNDLKYSMTKNLYDQPSKATVQYEEAEYNGVSGTNEGQFSYNQEIQKFQQQGEYHVDYDPEILADIQRLRN